MTNELREKLTDLLAALKAEEQKPFRMPENIDVLGAIRLLREHIPVGAHGRMVSVEIKVNSSSYDGELGVNFEVYDGKKFFQDNSLSLAVQKAITANMQSAPVPSEEVGAVVDAALECRKTACRDER